MYAASRLNLYHTERLINLTKLVPDSIRYVNGVMICEKIIPDSARATKYVASWVPKGGKMKPGGRMSPIGVTVHNTEDLKNVYDDAEQYTRATYPNQNMAGACVHYYVDDVGAWQNLREDEPGWHAGDGNGNGNKKTIAIECIMDGSGSKEDLKARENTARLVAHLLEKYGWDTSDVYTHNHWIGKPDKIIRDGKKNCPLYLLPDWRGFLSLVQSYIYSSVRTDDFHTQSYKIKVIADTLNYRKGPGVSYKVVGTIKDKGVYTIVQEENGWGQLKSLVGWINLKYTKKL